MSNYKIELILVGKNQLGNVFNQAAADAQKMKTSMGAAATGIGSSFTAQFNKIKSEASSLGSSLRSTFTSIGGAITSIFAGVSLAELAKSAGDAESKWNRIAAYTNASSESLTLQKAEIKAIANHYGVINGELGSIYETNLRFFGDQQKSAKYAEGIAATSKTTGLDMVTIQNAIISGELGRNKQLQKSVLTEQQRNKYLADGEITQEEIGQILQENQETVANNPALINDANSEWNRMETEINSLKTSLGKSLLPIIKDVAPVIGGIANKFTELNTLSGGWLGNITGVALVMGTLAAPLGMAWPFLKDMASATTTMATKIWDYVNGLRTANSIPSTVTTPGGQTYSTAGAGAGAGAVSGALIGAGAVFALSYATFKIAQASITTEQVQQANTEYGPNTATILSNLQNGDYLGVGSSVIRSLFTGGSPTEKAAEQEKLTALGPKIKSNLQDWGPFTGIGSTISKWTNPLEGFKSLTGGGNLLSKLLPGTASAAGTGGKSNIMGDLFGKNGALDFSRFGLKMPNIKWPNAGQILNKITDTIKDHIPKFNWEIPNVGQILGGIWDKINPLNWNIPSVNDLLGQTWQKIKDLFWNIPGVGDFLNQTWQKIRELVWPIIDPGSILAKVAEKILPFSWPWGPAPVGQGDGGGGGGAFRGPPKGPLSTTVSSTIAARSGLGYGNIASAMSKQFKGVSAFTDIANGMADHLGYQFYFGDQKSNRQVWDSGTCNCYDGAQFLMDEASRKMGLGAGLTNGVWNGTAIPHTWATIGGQPFDMAAMLLRGQWNPPSGPGNIHQFMTDIGPGLEYLSYGGHKKDPYDAVSNGGNCFDMTLGIMGIASQLFGVPAQMKWGHWDGQSHVWANLAGKDYDLSNMALNRTYSPPPQGPGSSDYGGVHFHKDAIKISGPIYGIDDLDSKIEAGFNKAQEKAIKKQERLTFGG